MPKDNVGASKVFVRGVGFRQFGPFEAALVDPMGMIRVLCLLEADPDNPRARPKAAWEALLKALPYGVTTRFLLSWWPDETQRAAFVNNMDKWPKQTSPRREALFEGLLATAVHTDLPFARTLVVEFRLPPIDTQAQWLLGVPEMLAEYGVKCSPLTKAEIEVLASRVLNPEV